MRISTRIVALAGAVALSITLTTSSALAHYCTPVNKQAGAGSIGTYNVVTESFTPNQRGGAFITVTDGATFSYDVYRRDVLPEGALAAGSGGDDQCDGQGVDNALVCLGIE